MKKVISLLLIFIMLFTVAGCAKAKTETKQEGNSATNGNVTSGDATENGTVNGENGKILASVLKEVNGRQVLYHNNEPYVFNAVHFRYDYLEKYLTGDVDKALADGMRLIKQNGYSTVIIYVPWSKIYDGKKYDLTYFTKQFKEAQKNDLKVLIDWFGSNVCGFGGYQSWQKEDYDKYPSLLDGRGEPVLGTGYADGKRIPDFSAEIYAKEEGEALQKICDWLAENDTDRRTVAIQICDEPNNNEGGYGQWMSQFKNYADYMDKLAAVVKNSNYSMVTYTVLMSAGTNQTLDGYTYDQRTKYLIDLPNLDFVGYSIYSPTATPKFDSIEQKGNLPVFIGLNPSSYCTAAQAVYTLANGYGGFCHYQLINHNGYDGGYYSVKGEYETGTVFGIRDGTEVLVNSSAFNGCLEVDQKEITAMNKSIAKLEGLIATTKEKNITHFNNKSKNDISSKKSIDNEKVTFTYKNTAKQYGGCGLMLKASDGNFYGFATLNATYTFASDINVTVGYYENGKWISEGEVKVTNKTFTAESGKAYQIKIK